MMSGIVNLKRHELEVLCAASGMDRLVGIGLSGKFEPGRGEMIEIIGTLIRDGIIVLKDEGLVVSEDIARIVKTIKSAERILVIAARAVYESRKCCYVCKDRTVVCERSSVENDAFRLSLLGSGSLLPELEEQGFIAGSGDGRGLCDIEMIKRDRDVIDLIKMSSVTETSREYMLRRCGARLVIDCIHPRSGVCIKRIGRSRLSGKDIMFVLESGKLPEVDSWDRDRFIKIFEEMQRRLIV